ncbi:MAG: hypothetical protein ABEH38_06555 [Flavobacteriales bacterium]
MRKGIHILFLALPFLLAFSSCKQEAKERPELEILSPDGGFQLEVGDTLELELEASAQDGLGELHFALFEENGQQALPGKSIAVSGKKLHDRFDYPIEEDPQGGSSSYTLRVIVEDQEGQKASDYAFGEIIDDPLRFGKAFVIRRPASNKLKIGQLRDLQNGVESFKNLTMDYSGSVANASYGELLIAGSQTGDLIAFDGMTGNERWRYQNQGSSPEPYFISLNRDREGDWALASLGTSRMKGFRGGSGPDLTVDALDDHIIREAVVTEGILLTEQEPIASGPRQWVTYYASTGAIGTQKQIPDRDIVRILEEGAGKALVLANENGQGKLFRYDLQGRYFESIVDLPSGRLRDGIRLEEGRTLLVHDQGLFVHQRGTDILNAMAADVPQAIAYDRAEGRIFCGTGTDLRVRDGQNGNVQWERSFPDSIRAVHVLYED